MSKIEGLVKVIKEIGKFELGVNELEKALKEPHIWKLLGPHSLDLAVRYGLTAVQIYDIATIPFDPGIAQEGLGTVGVKILKTIAVLEVPKVSWHYLIEGLEYMNKKIIDYKNRDLKRSNLSNT